MEPTNFDELDNDSPDFDDEDTMTVDSAWNEDQEDE